MIYHGIFYIGPRSRIGSMRSRQPIRDFGLDMRSDIKHDVMYSLYRISVHEMHCVCVCVYTTLRLYRTVRH